jgi:hypothetical protein
LIQPSPLPVLIRNDEFARVWYKQDLTFKQPKAYLLFEITSLVAYENPEAVVMTRLFCRLLQDALNEYFPHTFVFLSFHLLITDSCSGNSQNRYFVSIHHRFAYDAEIAGLRYALINTIEGIQVFL